MPKASESVLRNHRPRVVAPQGARHASRPTCTGQESLLRWNQVRVMTAVVMNRPMFVLGAYTVLRKGTFTRDFWAIREVDGRVLIEVSDEDSVWVPLSRILRALRDGDIQLWEPRRAW